MSPINHAFTSPHPDAADPTLVNPTAWNSVHLYTMQDAVSLSGNTAGVLANISSGTLYLAGGNNLTLSQNGNSVTLSAFAQTLQTQSRFNVTLSGNTDGALALISSGVMTVAGGNNITLSQAGNAVTISAANSGTAPPIATAGTRVLTANSVGTITRFAAEDHGHEGVYAAGVSNVGNSAGDTGVQAGRIVFAGGNNVTLSVGTAANALQTITISAANSGTAPPIGTAVKAIASVGSTGTITRFAPEDHQHAGVFSAGVSNVGNTSGDTLVGPIRLVLAGGDNITLSGATAAGNLMTVTISGGAGGAAGSNTFGGSNLGNTAGTSGVVSGSAVRYLFAGGSNIVLSQSLNGVSGTLTVSAGYARSIFEANAPPVTGVISMTRFPNQPWFTPFTMDVDGLSVKTVKLLMSRAAGVSLVATVGLGLYTMSNATRIDLVSSTTHNYSLTASGQFSGIACFDITGLSALTLSRGQWWMGLHLSATGTAQGNLNVLGPGEDISFVRSINPGTDQTAATAASVGLLPFHGVLSFSSAALPASVGQADMLGGAGNTQAGHFWFGIRQV